MLPVSGEMVTGVRFASTTAKGNLVLYQQDLKLKSPRCQSKFDMPASSSSLSLDEFTAFVAAALTYHDITVSGMVGGNNHMYCSADGQVCQYYNILHTRLPLNGTRFFSVTFFFHHTVVVELYSVCHFEQRSCLLGLCCFSILL